MPILIIILLIFITIIAMYKLYTLDSRDWNRLMFCNLYIDIDECQHVDHRCSAMNNKECINTQGSYFCQCMAGFKNSVLGVCIGKPTMYHMHLQYFMMFQWP